jgi:hypothetical protein
MALFLVQSINGCSAIACDRDQSLSSAGSNFNAAAATTGACAPSDVGYGVRAEGVELEASLVPARNFRVAAGLTYAKTSYRENLVGSKTGAPLDPALRKLPGDNLSNAPELVATSSVTWTPDIGSNGMSGLVYIDGRMTSDYNTGSDLSCTRWLGFNAVFIFKPDESGELSLGSEHLHQISVVAFNSPFQAVQLRRHL